MSLHWTIGLKARLLGDGWHASDEKGFDGGGLGLRSAGRYDEFLRFL
jgi:hypothetical protein